ncbi:Full Developmental regulatory wetA [Cordyceps militaris]|uniref:Full Developmental regulatory wetA n=1 Tax=Cordyceps militaris TaxID=73501 RepID=A0A2H4SR67_CORMI|nr:Full Developmental regulatory wetA [Cordyceps militaris]
MALWTSSYPVDAGDRDPSFAWPDTDVPSAGLEDSQPDLFSQFLDFDAGHGGATAVAAEPFYLDPSQHQHHIPHNQHESSTTSSGVSNADDFDFLSSNPAGYDVDTSALAMFAQDPAASAMYTSSGMTVSDTALERLEGISLHSPKKDGAATLRRAVSPAPEHNMAAVATATTTGRRSKKMMEALSSTLRKATMRKTRKVSQAMQRAVSPSLENPPMAIKPGSAQVPPRGRRAHRAHTQHALHLQQQQQQQQSFPESPPPLQVDTGLANGAFVSGQFDDPFGGEISPRHAPPPQQPPQMRYYSQGGLGTPMDSPTRNAAMLQQQQQGIHHWQQQQQQHGAHWSAASSQQDLWWGGAGGPGGIDAKNIDANMAMHSQHGELPYDVRGDGGHAMAAAHNNGLMIHMPQPRAGTGVNELVLNAHTYLPPPPPPQVPTEASRSARPPKAPSSGARHHHQRTMSSSPMRKQRAPSASPSPGTTTRQSRHSSGASAASSAQRSASGRVSVPGTPSGIKKRRSRDAGSGSFSADDGGGGGGGGISLGGGGGGGGGFVNFTPNDGSVLMTGVAPSGSSKTKARREKEAMERRRRLSEAAMKAVAAAGGDIEKLKEQGFEL